MNQPPTFEPFVPARPKGQAPAEQPQEQPKPRARKARQEAPAASEPTADPPKKPRKKREKKERKVAMSAAFKIAATLKQDDLPFFESFREAFDKLSAVQRRRIWEALAELYK